MSKKTNRAESRKRYNKRYYKRTEKYKQRLWTKEEEKMVLAHEITDTELSAKIKRSVRSIQVHRSKLKKREN